MNLSAEQQKKIEENKAAALLKKQQYINKINSASGTHGQTSTSVGREKLNNNSFQIKFPKKGAQKQNIAYLNINFTAISENRFIADTSYHEQTIEIFKTIPGRLYGKRFAEPLYSYVILLISSFLGCNY